MLDIKCDLQADLKRFVGLEMTSASFDALGLVDSACGNFLLSFLDGPAYAPQLNENQRIKGAFVRRSDAHLLRADIEPLVVDDPKWFFFTLVSARGKNRVRAPTTVSSSARIHPSAVISQTGVCIGDEVVIEPGVIVMPDVTIESGALIRAGAVLGTDGFEHKRTSRGVVSVTHDGSLFISAKAEIGPNNTVNKGFSYRHTIVGEETKLDGLVHYAHGVQSGRRCFIAASATLAGHVTLGDDVWIGPSSCVSNRVSLGNRASVTLGSVVVRDVAAGEKVTGNFAVNHRAFLRSMARSSRNS